MKIAIIGSRKIKNPDIEKFVSADDEIVSGGAVGVDLAAAKFARRHGLRLTEILPQYKKYGRGAPIIRNREIVDYAEKVVAFWDGRSRGTLSVIEYAQKTGKPCEIVLCE